MKMKLTANQIEKIESINGTRSERYEYIEAVAEVLGTDTTTCRWNKNHMMVVAIDKTHILDIKTKTVKGQRFITELSVWDETGRLQMLLERKRGAWVEWNP